MPPTGGNVGVWLHPRAPWTPVLITRRVLAARPALRQGSCTTSPNYTPKTVWQPGENSRTLYVLVRICLPAVWLQGEACLLWAPGNGGVFASKKEGVARVQGGSCRPTLLVQTVGPKPQLPREFWARARAQEEAPVTWQTRALRGRLGREQFEPVAGGASGSSSRGCGGSVRSWGQGWHLSLLFDTLSCFVMPV